MTSKNLFGYQTPFGAFRDRERASTVSDAIREIPSQRRTIADLMSRHVVSVRPDLSLDAAMQLFLETKLRAVPVVDEYGKVLGMLEEHDLQAAIYASPKARDEGATRSVSEAMQPVPFVVHEQTPITQAAGLMVEGSVYRVLVVSSDNSVIGILSASDILYWIACSDGYVLSRPQR